MPRCTRRHQRLRTKAATQHNTTTSAQTCIRRLLRLSTRAGKERPIGPRRTRRLGSIVVLQGREGRERERAANHGTNFFPALVRDQSEKVRPPNFVLSHKCVCVCVCRRGIGQLDLRRHHNAASNLPRPRASIEWGTGFLGEPEE